MAIMPHCVVCGFERGYQEVQEVTFADYAPDWPHPRSADGSPIVGWSNELGITAAPGTGLFCRVHFTRARRLRHLTSTTAVEMMCAGADRGPSGLLRRLRLSRRGARP
ncbi:MAG: hypothetical protein VYA67_15095 [Actinomycetota bacterium]|nr:hypothetical protein [Actinomycetota bacterium]